MELKSGQKKDTYSSQASGNKNKSTFQLQDNRPRSVAQRKANTTGLPDNLKSGVENLSGHSMDDVKVHYNSDKPAQLNAHAYAQGTDIHIASGQEKHLPHEAWHVVQQKQGRVTPTMQMKGKVNINDDAGLEKEADVMGGKALQYKSNSSNQPIENNKIVSQRLIQRYELKPFEAVEIRDLKKSPKAEELGWDEASIDRLVKWSKNMKQISSTIQNVKRAVWEEFEILESGDSLNNQILKTNKDGKDEKTIEALGNASIVDTFPNALHPLTKVLTRKHGKSILNTIKAKLPVINKAYGISTGVGREIIAAQKSFQDWLITQLSVGEIMSAQRSIGFEFEFARYENNGDALGAHAILGKSQNLSALFPLPFVLETDSGNELEIGMPPMLIGLINSGPDKTATAKLWNVLRAMMGAFRQANIDGAVNHLPLAAQGIGTAWVMNAASANLQLIAGRPSKAGKAKDQVYSQINISLTPKEIADFISGKGKARYKNYEHELFAEGYEGIMGLLAEATGEESKIAIIHISKGLSNLLAIPSINMFTESLYDDFAKYDVYSTVKETFGIWIKDSIPNIVDNSVTAGKERAEVLALLKKHKTGIEALLDGIMKKGMAFIAKDMPVVFENKPDDFDHGAHKAQKLAQYLTAFTTELTLTLNTLISRLTNAKPMHTKNEGAQFGGEHFPTEDKRIKTKRKKPAKIIKAVGEGVRKETFVNIPQGIGKQEHMHLAEIRNEGYIDDFLMP